MVSRQKQLFFDLLESAPSVVFILYWRQTGDLEAAGWLGCMSALAMFAVLYGLRGTFHPILVGVNLHLAVITPVIVGIFEVGYPEVGRLAVEYAHAGVLLTVLGAGLFQTRFSKKRFSRFDGVTDRQQIAFSLVLLVVCGVGALLALLLSEQRFIIVILTISGLVFGRNFLQARMVDRGAGANGLAIGALQGSGNPDLETVA